MSDTVSVGAEVTGAAAPNQVEADPNNAVLESKATPDASPAERPAWLPEKFKSAEDMASAYASLEQKLGSKETNETPAPTAAPSKEVLATMDKFRPFSDEMVSLGKLSNESYTKLDGLGYPREMVDAYIAGQQAIGASAVAAIKADAGGEEGFTAMGQWATNALPQAELDAYNAAVESGNKQQASLAVKGLYARYQASEGNNAPKLLHGAANRSSGAAPIRSNAELVSLMRDARYQTDSGYRDDVAKRLAMSDILN